MSSPSLFKQIIAAFPLPPIGSTLSSDQVKFYLPLPNLVDTLHDGANYTRWSDASEHNPKDRTYNDWYLHEKFAAESFDHPNRDAICGAHRFGGVEWVKAFLVDKRSRVTGKVSDIWAMLRRWWLFQFV